MGIRDWLIEKLNPAQPAIAMEEGDSKTSTTSYTVKRAYYEVEVVNRGVNLIVDAFASISFDVKGKLRGVGVYVPKEKGKNPTKKSIEKLISFRPNPYQNADSFKRAVGLDLLLEGNAFLYFDGVFLYHLPASNIEIITDNKTYIKGYKYSDDTPFEFNEIIHIKDNGVNSIYRGDSRLLSALPAINLLKSMLSYQENFFRNNAVPGLVLKTPNILSSKIKQRVLEEWIANYNPARGGKRPAILDGDWDIDNLGHTDFRELDFKESVETQEKAVLKALGIPPILLDSGNNANIAPNLKLFYNNTVLPLVEKFTNALEFYFGYDLKPVLHDVIALRPELKEEAAYFSSLVNGGIITPNEARNKLRYASIDGGDTIRVPANIAGSASDPSQGGRPKQE